MICSIVIGMLLIGRVSIFLLLFNARTHNNRLDYRPVASLTKIYCIVYNTKIYTAACGEYVFFHLYIYFFCICSNFLIFAHVCFCTRLQDASQLSLNNNR